MALLGTYINVTTLATFATQSSASFAHGLSAIPDIVLFNLTATVTASTASAPMYGYNADATNVTVYNLGQGNGGNNLKCVAIVFHSIIR